jgi:putative ABC transport system substrate-binding protein
MNAKMKRREFISLLGGAAASYVSWPLAARAQQPGKLPTIGFVGSDSPDLYADRLRAFRLGLKSTGFIEGQNVAIEYRWAEGRNDNLPALTTDLVHRQVAVIVAPTTPSVLAAKAATETIPIVFFVAGDPVDLGLVASLGRPSGNLTGATTLTLEVGPKWLQFLHEMVPNATSLALLINPTSPNLAAAQTKDLQAAARSRGLQLHVLQASNNRDFDDVFSSASRLRAGGLVISSDSFFFSRSKELATLPFRHAVPTIFGFREFVGGLMREWLSRLRAARSHIWFQVGGVDEAKAALGRGGPGTRRARQRGWRPQPRRRGNIGTCPRAGTAPPVTLRYFGSPLENREPSPQ